MEYLHVFIDESGNYDFSPKGTKYLVITSLVATDIGPAVLELYKLKHDLINSGTDIEYFHAAEDRQVVRNGVFDVLSGLSNIRVDCVVVEKRKTAPSVRPLHRFYPMMVENLLKYPFDQRGMNISSFDRVFIFLDRASARRKDQEALKKGVKLHLARHLANVPYIICMHSSASHPYLQVVDYISWAVYIKWERGEDRPYEMIRHFVRSEFPIFQHGRIDWY